MKVMTRRGRMILFGALAVAPPAIGIGAYFRNVARHNAHTSSHARMDCGSGLWMAMSRDGAVITIKLENVSKQKLPYKPPEPNYNFFIDILARESRIVIDPDRAIDSEPDPVLLPGASKQWVLDFGNRDGKSYDFASLCIEYGPMFPAIRDVTFIYHVNGGKKTYTSGRLRDRVAIW